MLPRKLLLFALLCSAPTRAETPPEMALESGSDDIRAAAQFLSLYRNEMDCENVGYIQTGEADEHFAPIFRSSDTDSSKTLSKKELMSNPFATQQSLLGISYLKMDQDKNGLVTADELRIYLNHAVTVVDSDSDGDVYPIEYEHALKTGKVLQQAASSAKPKKQQKPDFVPPWIRHVKALNHMKASKPQTKESAQVSTAQPE